MQDFFPIQVARYKVYATIVIAQVSTQPNTDVSPENLVTLLQCIDRVLRLHFGFSYSWK